MPVELTSDHDDLRRQMREFSQLMMIDPPDKEDLMRRRIAFSKMFRDHMCREDEATTSIRRTGSGPAQAAAVEHSALVRALFLRYSEHIKQWTPATMSADWRGYGRAVIALQNGLYELMDWEESNLFHHLDAPTRFAA